MQMNFDPNISAHSIRPTHKLRRYTDIPGPTRYAIDTYTDGIKIWS